MSTDLVPSGPAAVVSPLPTRAVAAREFSDAQLEIIRANGGSNLEPGELEAFLHVVRRTGLDPLARQIYAIKRRSTAENRSIMSIQTGIDGYRLVADRTGRYAPSERAPEIEWNDGANRPEQITVFVKKLTDDGTWHEVPGTARYEEFVQKKDGKPTKFWADMPYNQLAKCAEAQALRRAFPNDLSGVWTTETAPREDFDVEVTAEPPKRAIAKPQSRSAAALPAPAAAAATTALNEGERRFEVTPAKVTVKQTKAKKDFWELQAQSGEKFTAWDKAQMLAFQTAKDRGWKVEVIEKQNGQYWNVLRVSMIEPAAASTPAPEPEQPDPVPPVVDVLDGVSDRGMFE